MLPGPDYIISCPLCGNLYMKKTLTTADNTGAIYWSDGKMTSPSLPEYPALTKCVCCGTFFWVEEAKEIGYFSRKMRTAYLVDGNPVVKTPDEWLEALPVAPPGLEDYYYLLYMPFISSVYEEIFVRQLMWWSYNDRARLSPNYNYTRHESEINTENIGILQELLPADDFTKILLKAEINRHLGCFDKCISLLSDPPEADSWVAAQIIEKARSGSRRVFRLVEQAELQNL